MFYGFQLGSHGWNLFKDLITKRERWVLWGLTLQTTLEIVDLPPNFRIQLIPHSYILLSHIHSLPGFCITVLSLQAKMGQGGGKTKNNLWARVHSKTACKRFMGAWVVLFFLFLGFSLMYSQTPPARKRVYLILTVRKRDGKLVVLCLLFIIELLGKESGESRTGQAGQVMEKKDKMDVFCNRIGRTKRRIRIYRP
ncbi:hypothetical protein DER46DRAFT_108108 [Fusarium sp. MPI-SDFR-AT-0072]|nr:hypothetical protein DER46DRAFT_108108 [Fusarium sp. MPI-SDFR-AT-0072]